ncbi:hypothetical protein GCM10010399_44100 [Dactylosporangium fulvum]|uniref:Uncharacterized protein n=1 Tax=Dactylosporangium fulvum TaxID=53359 RepID=A0ABY5W7C4_9ACTN|nr:hypothetical protein [Dactylosporangium fulvum]UWP85923.1 hypothetical protein Dfulv_17390 [Dactylosporangium fulvum]
MSRHGMWLAIVADADRSPGSVRAGEVADIIRHVVGAEPGTPLAPAVIRDPRTAAELSAAYLREWRRRHPEAGPWVAATYSPVRRRPANRRDAA